MKENNKLTYIPVINTLRGIAALLVVFYHFIYTTTDYIKDVTILNISSYGNLGVTIFFVISGIVIPLAMIKHQYKITDLPIFFKKRLIRIEIPYLAAIVLSILYLIARDYVPTSMGPSLVPDFKELMLNIFYLVPFSDDAKWINPVFWTLAVEFQYYIFLALFFPLFISKKLTNRLFLYILILFMGYFYPHNLFKVLPIFMIGIMYALYITRNIKIDELLLVYATMILLMIYMDYAFIKIIVALVTILTIYLFKNHNSKIGNFFGNISYSLYLIHVITGGALINLMTHYFHEPIEKFFVIAVGILFSILCAYIFYRVVEKPSKDLSSNYKRYHS